MRSLQKIIEIGGGYGYLMRDFLDRNPVLRTTMLNVSPYLLQKHRYILKERDVRYLQTGIMDVVPGYLRSFDMAILNDKFSMNYKILPVFRSCES